MTDPFEQFIDATFDTFPADIRHRKYQYPGNYPGFPEVRRIIMSPLALVAGASALGMASVPDRDKEALAAGYMIRFKAWQSGHPTYLLSAPLITLLAQTDRLDDPNIDTDSRPPFPAAYFVPPKHLVGLANGSYVILLSYAMLDAADFRESRHVAAPPDMSGRRLYVQADMSDGAAFYAKLPVADDGSVGGTSDMPYTDSLAEHEALAAAFRARRGKGERARPPRVLVPAERDMVTVAANLVLSLATYLNMEPGDAVPERLGKIVPPNRRKGIPAREFWEPATLGDTVRAPGIAVGSGGGTHASPHSHLRRGHWRRVWFGKGRTQCRRRWLKPTMVHPSVGAGS